MGCITAVGSRYPISAEADRSPRPPVTGRAAVGEARTDREIDMDVPEAVFKAGTLPFQSVQLALKELPAAANGAEWIEGNHVLRGVQVRTGAALSDLAGIRRACEGAGDASFAAFRALLPSISWPNNPAQAPDAKSVFSVGSVASFEIRELRNLCALCSLDSQISRPERM